MKYCTLQSVEFGHKFITAFNPEKDTEESICFMSDGTKAYRFLNHHDSIAEAQISIYGRSYPFKEWG